MYENLLANVPTDLWIGGKWRKASDGGRFDVIDPATENKVASVASATVEDANLKAAVDLLVSKYPTEEVSVYLNAFYTMNDVRWPNLEAMLKEDPRLQFAG